MVLSMASDHVVAFLAKLHDLGATLASELNAGIPGLDDLASVTDNDLRDDYAATDGCCQAWLTASRGSASGIARLVQRY